MNSLWPLSAAIFSICLGVLSQFALKAGVAKAIAAHSNEAGPGSLIVRTLMQPTAVVGLTLYGAAALMWIYVLARWEVSKAYPLVGLGLALSLLLGGFVFGEHVTLHRTIGVSLIFVGVVLVATS